MKITVHHLEQSRSSRILWLLEELGVPYEIKYYKRDPATHMAEPKFKALHPLGKSPCVEVDGQMLLESGAVVETLLDLTGDTRLRPPAGTPERIRYNFWTHYAEGSAMQTAILRWVMRSLPAGAPEEIRGAVEALIAKRDANLVAPQVASILDYWNAELGRSKFLAGDAFSAADIMMGNAADAYAGAGELEGRPALKAWHEGLRARPAHQRASEKGKAPA